MKKWMVLWVGLLATTLALAQVKVVYHLSEGVAQATRALVNIRNHLDADKTAKVVVVAHGAGIDFLLDGALNAKGQPFAGDIGELAGRGVEFRACNNTLQARHLTRDNLVMEASVVPSGVAEIARLQSQEGYAYLHP